MKNEKGFTLVELLAVIVILAIIMIIAIPSVLTTVETANRKTMLEYHQKVLLAVERKFIEDKNFGNLKYSGGNYHYVYDIKKDLDMINTGSFFGYVMVSASNKKTAYDVFLANDNFALYASTDSHEPTTEDLIDNSKIEEFYIAESNGAITSLNQITADIVVSVMIKYTLCDKGDEYYYEASTGRLIGQTVFKLENWATGKCKENSAWDIINSLK